MKRLVNTVFLLMIAFSAYAQADADFDGKVRSAVQSQLEKYPESTLKDLYKSFFQDRFGPGHIINDADAAERYLRQEINSYDKVMGETFEPTGWQHNYYRVNLSVLKDGQVSPDAIVDALVRSANSVEPVSMEEWINEWTLIERIIKSMELSLPGYVDDLNDINSRLANGKYVGHHSEAYNKAYEPHYRIISRKIFEEEIFPFIKK